MNNRICLDTRIVFLLVIMIILVGVYQYLSIKNTQPLQNKSVCPPCHVCPACPTSNESGNQTIQREVTTNNQVNNTTNTLNHTVSSGVINQEPEQPTEVHVHHIHDTVVPRVIPRDPVREYDQRKVNDPLEQPTRRVARHQIHPMVLRDIVDLPTQGYPDNFIQLGTLLRSGDGTSDSKILRLFGRQEFPNSTRYEYYTLINSGNDMIKVPITVKGNKELWDDDTISIPELGYDYTVKLYKYDAPRYYPDIL